MRTASGGRSMLTVGVKFAVSVRPDKFFYFSPNLALNLILNVFLIY